MPSRPENSPDKEMIKAFEAAGVVEYLEYLQSGKRILWTNFRAGVARGFGITIGASVVVGILIWILTKLVALPLVGEYFVEAQKFVHEYMEKTNYSDELERMNILLEKIDANTRGQGVATEDQPPLSQVQSIPDQSASDAEIPKTGQ